SQDLHPFPTRRSSDLENVTIRINGEQVPFNENYKVNDWQQAQEEMSATIDEGIEEDKYQVNVVKATKQSIQKPTLLILSVLAARSEERRVGKECRVQS